MKRDHYDHPNQIHSDPSKKHWPHVYENSWIGCFGLWVLSSFCCECGNIHIWNNCQLTMCWEKGSDRFWEPFRADSTDYPTLSTFLWPLSSIAHESLNSTIAQCFAQNWRKSVVSWTKQGARGRFNQILPPPHNLPRQTARPHDFRRENIPYLLSDFSIFVIRSGPARGDKKCWIYFLCGFWWCNFVGAKVKRLRPISIFNLSCDLAVKSCRNRSPQTKPWLCSIQIQMKIQIQMQIQIQIQVQILIQI